jgi:hypothetical protein
MFGWHPGMDDQGNILIPFGVTETDVPFQRWQMVSTKIWDSPGPVAIRSIILSNTGEIWVTYAREINDENEMPKEEIKEITTTITSNPDTGATLVQSDEKRSYE